MALLLVAAATSPEMVAVPGGRVLIGSSEDEAGHNRYEVLREVRLSRPYLVATTEVSQELWLGVMGTNPSSFADCNRCPVESITWFEAIRFCNRLSEIQGLRSAYRIEGEEVEWIRAAHGYRLPTEAEWERAARAGTSTAFWFGESGTPGDMNSNSSPNAAGKTFPVATYPPNAFGLFDVHGNVWEWCWDRFAEVVPADTLDPIGPRSGEGRVSRGGSWSSAPLLCRSASRNNSSPDYRCSCVGFRVVRSILKMRRATTSARSSTEPSAQRTIRRSKRSIPSPSPK